MPLSRLALQWLLFCWPFLASERFIAQKRGEKPGDPKPIALRRAVRELARPVGRDGL